MDLSKFDIIVLLLLAISGGVGFLRGAIREIAAFVALVAAAVLAILALPMAAPLLRHVIHTPWLATAGALVLVFGVTYVALRLIGAALARQAHSANLGFLDRSMGLLLGLGRGLVVLGALFLMFNAATPPDLRPKWITEAKTWPLARNMGRLEERLAPKGLDAAGRLRPAFDRAVKDGSRDRTATGGYDARGRGEDDLERSR